MLGSNLNFRFVNMREVDSFFPRGSSLKI
jgi:hypothetical protein